LFDNSWLIEVYLHMLNLACVLKKDFQHDGSGLQSHLFKRWRSEELNWRPARVNDTLFEK
jgi:hypothetical protein